jgi:hypothetical protein
MKNYQIQDKEAGNVIEAYLTHEQAETKLKEYEEMDILDDTFTPAFYEIVEMESTEQRNSMKTHFEYKGFEVKDYKDKSFAHFHVTKTSRCFNDIESAILYCIAMANRKQNTSENEILAYVDTFITMINK